MAVDTDELQRQIDEVRVMAEDALDKFPLRSTTTPGAVRERHIHDLGKHPGGVIAARVHNSAAITISNNTLTVLTFDSERYDTDTIHSTSSNTSRLTAKTAGKYIITGNVRWDDNGTGRRLLSILVNGSTTIARGETAILSVETSQNISTTYDLAVDDFVELEVFQSSGGNLDVKSSSNFSPEFMMARVGAAGTAGGGTPGTDHGALTGLGDDDHSLYLLAAGSRAGSTGGAQSFGSTGIKADVIAEDTAAAGVTVDGVLLKDNLIAAGAVPDTHGVTPSAHHTQNTDTGTSNSSFAVDANASTPRPTLQGQIGGTGNHILALRPASTMTGARIITFPDAAGEVALDSELHTKYTDAEAKSAAPISSDVIWDTAGDIVQADGADSAVKLAITVPDAGLLNVLGVENGETALAYKAVFDATNPSTQAHGDSAATGTAIVAARRDHKHAMPAAGAGKFSYSITVENPTSSEDISIAFTNRAITVTEIRAVLIGSSTPSVSWTIKHHATDRNNAGAAVVTAGTTTTSTTAGSDVTSFDDATIPADSYVWLESTAKSGTVTEIHITILGTED